MRIRQAVAGTHAGAVRTINEDAVLRLGRVPLYAIADGMGGSGAGDIAAQLALDVVKRHAMAIRDANMTVARARTPENRRALHKTFDTVFNRASRQIREEAARRGHQTMGASAVMATLVDEYAYIVHIGDARAYLYRRGTIQRLTEDHTLAELKLRRGRITRAEYENHPERHVLYQSLGAPFELDVDLAEVRVEDGDILFLCSDGIVGALKDDEIAAGLDVGDLNGSLRGLLRACIQNRCADNISAVLLGMEGEARTELVPKEEAPTNPAIPQVSEGEAEQDASDADDATDVSDLVEQTPPAPAFDVRGTLFAGFSPPERQVLAAFLEEREHDVGTRVIAEGDPSDAVHVIVGGRVFLTRDGIPLGETAEGVLGEIGFERDTLQVVQAVAKAQTTTLVLTRARFKDLLAEHPALAARLAMGMSDAQADLSRRLGARLSAVGRALRGRF